jgi:ATP-dependent Clp protease ATP-binding subunit ClpA
MQDAQGRELTFKNCIIIFTSNIGADLLQRPSDPADNMKLMEALRRHFRPEFINRIDEIVPFYPLLFEDIRTILRLNLQAVNERLKERSIRLRVFQGAYEFLAERGYNREFGARELRRAVERYVMNPISERVVAGAFQAGDVIEILDEGGELVFRKGETLIEQGALRA